MYHITVNNKSKFDVQAEKEGILLDGVNAGMSIVRIDDKNFHVLVNNKSYRVEEVSVDAESNTIKLKVNGVEYSSVIKDQFDDLLQQLGLDNLKAKKLNEIKAPMPGLVLKVLVEVGASFQKGDNLIVLEAMKMENILKAPADGVVKAIKIQPGDKVEKNEVLLQLQ